MRRVGSHDRRVSRSTATYCAVSLVAHALFLLAVNTWALNRTPPRSSTQPMQSASRQQAASPSPSCEADAALGTAAQLLYCATPLGRQAECMSRVLDHFSASRITCNAVAFPTEVALVDAKVLDRIEPEPLLELLTPIERKKFEEAQKEAIEQRFRQEQKKQEQKKRNQQVVEITRPTVEEEPEDAQYVSEYNSRVERQTVARGSTEEMVERPENQALDVKKQPREAVISEIPKTPTATADPDKPEGRGGLAMRGPEGPEQDRQLEQPAVKGGAVDGSDGPVSDNAIVASRGDGPSSVEKAEARQAGGGSEGGGRPLVPDLRPTEDILERAAGGGSVDHLENVASGETTALSSKRWKYATFFNRMKRRVGQNWHPAQVYARRDPKGNVYGQRDRITYLQISLDPSGTIARIHVLRSSGVDFLDDEAMRAFRAAHPFPNPPRGLVDSKSQLITFTFGFHFELGKPRGWKIFRQQ
ncbi:MAG: cell envelope integrity protein TolA [Proteobacteria bacterium]|nr:cell envelope integrity protein TolA [Pseudomonadota bacterium]